MENGDGGRDSTVADVFKVDVESVLESLNRLGEYDIKEDVVESSDGNGPSLPSVVPESVNLYQLLDHIPNGRRTMNSLFYGKINVGKEYANVPFANFEFNSKVEQYAIQWYAEEKTHLQSGAANSLVGNDTPINFSWSSNNKIATGSLMYQHLTKSKTELATETTNQKLQKIVTKGLNEVNEEIKQWEKENKNNVALRAKPDNDKAQENISEFSSTSTTSSRPGSSVFANSTFKVDPLEEFVVTALPKQRKKKVQPVKKKKGLFWFLTGSKKKEKPSSSEIKNENNSQIPIVEPSYVHDGSTENNTNDILDSDKLPKVTDQGNGKFSNNDSNITINNNNSATGPSKQFNSINISEDSKNQELLNVKNENVDDLPDGISNDYQTTPTKVENTNLLDMETTAHNTTLVEQPRIHEHKHEAILNSDSDSDFGEFEVANKLDIPPINQPPSIIFAETQPLTKSDTSLMSEFVPLEPKKRPE